MEIGESGTSERISGRTCRAAFGSRLVECHKEKEHFRFERNALLGAMNIVIFRYGLVYTSSRSAFALISSSFQ